MLCFGLSGQKPATLSPVAGMIPIVPFSSSGRLHLPIWRCTPTHLHPSPCRSHPLFGTRGRYMDASGGGTGAPCPQWNCYILQSLCHPRKWTGANPVGFTAWAGYPTVSEAAPHPTPLCALHTLTGSDQQGARSTSFWGAKCFKS